MTLSAPHGPHLLTLRRQVTVPKALLDRLGLGAGDAVHFLFDDDRQQILLVPSDRLAALVGDLAGGNPTKERA
ncbi:AbrB family looped-hinge helix DNA binding protein [Curtobacterium sp. PhB42]|uniref:AbrB/MazE/SpoVT family DNA-binding domain-containing protein n=1 Tax=unclassified Curtobacterium TaxID=257496 RepID=UPI001046D411|nr:MULTISPECIES: AbrB/MazE/SpoVT family DNA-binding domain-containing protein [unclassified Curtobacterium]TCU42693.1 AbrB family looped-hinge helix DNA binding protein [Curtobacterium sp. PhB146]TDW38460.1 AbrB family looped-hinge helix DNA binding protein [Curtobacterium sp. PhB42]TDW48467.1 AbrB family looped-hinge helix DNA binding protein [Curtobacterium sp. PhB190]